MAQLDPGYLGYYQVLGRDEGLFTGPWLQRHFEKRKKGVMTAVCEP